MSYYHIEGNGGFKNLPKRILVREDGYLGAYKFYGEPIVDYWYVPEAENAKLRELVRRYGEYTGQDRCEGCVYKSRCNDGYVDECWQLTEIRGLARELGIEVPE